MTQQPRRKAQKRKPLGQGIAWTDNALDDMSNISDADIAAAVSLWQSEAPKELRSLLDAKVEKEPK